MLVVDESEMDATQYFANRTKLLGKLEKEQGLNPYPHKFEVSMPLNEFVLVYGPSIGAGEKRAEVKESVAGRISSIRQQGKLVFLDLVGDGAKIQLMSDPKIFGGGEEKWATMVSTLRRGDVVGAVGNPGKSKKLSPVLRCVQHSVMYILTAGFAALNALIGDHPAGP